MNSFSLHLPAASDARRASTPSLPRALLMLALVLCAGGPPTRVAAQWDDFTDGNDTGWTHYTPLGSATAQFTFPAGGYRIEALVSPNPAAGGGRAASVRADVTYTDFYVVADLVDWNNSMDQAIGLVARMQQLGLGSTDGYALTLQVADHTAVISRIDNEVPSDVAGSLAAFTLNPAKDYRLVFLGQGTRLEGRIYEWPNARTPVLTVTGTDALYTTGACGLIVADLSSANTGTGDATFDQYVAMDVEPPRITAMMDVSRSLTLQWPQPGTGFNLEYAPALASAAWTTVPAGAVVSEGTNRVYRETAIPGNRLFRLNRVLP